MRVDVVTIFPDYLAPLELSLIRKARRAGLIDLAVHDLRVHHDRHRTVDDTPCGGGCRDGHETAAGAEALSASRGWLPTPPPPRPRAVGVPFTSRSPGNSRRSRGSPSRAGRYEGIDERVFAYAESDLRWRVTPSPRGLCPQRGRVARPHAMVEAIGRLIPGVVGNAGSLVEESHEGRSAGIPRHTKPATWTPAEPAAPGTPRDVPPSLLSGDHAGIAAWRHQQQLGRTTERRPDLLHAAAATTTLGSPAVTTLRPARTPRPDPRLLGARGPLRGVARLPADD